MSITICFFHIHIVPGTAGYSAVAEKMMQTLTLSNCRLMTTSHRTLSNVYVAQRHATLDISPVTSDSSCLTASWQAKERLYAALHPSHLEHLRQCSVSLPCCSSCAAGARQSYWKDHFPKISHDHLKSLQFVAKDSEVISRMRHWYYWGFFFPGTEWESTPLELLLASKYPLWHACLNSSNKSLQWYLYSLPVTDT